MVLSYTTTEILRGQLNYAAWLREFKVVAQSEGLYELLTGKENVLAKPTRPTPLVLTDFQHNPRDSVEVAAGKKAAYQDLSQQYTAAVQAYKMDNL
jgi:hypothetical protein